MSIKLRQNQTAKPGSDRDRFSPNPQTKDHQTECVWSGPVWFFGQSGPSRPKTEIRKKLKPRPAAGLSIRTRQSLCRFSRSSRFLGLLCSTPGGPTTNQAQVTKPNPTQPISFTISSSPSSPYLHSTLGNTFFATSTASCADFYIIQYT